jgi:hypothetical protein
LDLGTPKTRSRPAKEGILDEFLSLSSATPARICSFGEKYGPLLIFCKEEAKESHNLVVTEECEVCVNAGLKFPKAPIENSPVTPVEKSPGVKSLG